MYYIKEAQGIAQSEKGQCDFGRPDYNAKYSLAA